MKTSIERIKLIDGKGKSRNGRKIRVTSTFENSTDKVWNRLLNVDTLIEICYPKATFHSCFGKLPETWELQRIYPFSLWIHGFIPLGRHEIVLEHIDQENGVIISREHNRIVTVWNHLIRVETTDMGKTTYTDEVEIYAGVFTYFTAIWSVAFYKHRQKKWQQIAKTL